MSGPCSRVHAPSRNDKLNEKLASSGLSVRGSLVSWRLWCLTRLVSWRLRCPDYPGILTALASWLPGGVIALMSWLPGAWLSVLGTGPVLVSVLTLVLAPARPWYWPGTGPSTSTNTHNHQGTPYTLPACVPVPDTHSRCLRRATSYPPGFILNTGTLPADIKEWRQLTITD